MGKVCTVRGVLLCLILLSSSASCETIGQAKRFMDGVSVVLSGYVTSMEPSECYIQTRERTSGIWVHANTFGVTPGQQVTATGTISTVNGERLVDNAILYENGGYVDFDPLGMSNKAVGGAWFGYQDCVSDFGWVWNSLKKKSAAWRPASGLNNTGLLVKVWGRVTAAYSDLSGTTRWFYIDDGFGAVGDLGDIGMLVYSNADVRDGDYVAVTGISSVESCLDDGSRLIRVIRTRSLDDIQILKQPTTTTAPLVDDFDADKLDPRWRYTPRSGQVSVTANPGWARLIMPESGIPDKTLYPSYPTNLYYYGPELLARVCGDWDRLDVKLHASFSPSPSAKQFISVMASATPNFDPAYPSGVSPLFRFGREITYGTYAYGAWGMATVPDDPCYFRLEKIGTSLYAGYSTDGVSYKTASTYLSNPMAFIAVYVYSNNPTPIGKPFEGFCDYVRFSKVAH